MYSSMHGCYRYIDSNCSISLDQLPVGQNGEEEELAAAARLDCSDQEDLSECSVSRKGTCPLSNVIHLNCISKHNQRVMHTHICLHSDKYNHIILGA